MRGASGRQSSTSHCGCGAGSRRSTRSPSARGGAAAAGAGRRTSSERSSGRLQRDARAFGCAPSTSRIDWRARSSRGGRPSPGAGRMTGAALDRLRVPRAVSGRPSASGSTTPGCAAGRPVTLGRRHRVLRARPHRGGGAMRMRREDQRRLLRGLRVGGLVGARAHALRCASRRAVHPRREARRHRYERGAVRGGDPRSPRRRRRDRLAIPRRGRGRAVPRGRGRLVYLLAERATRQPGDSSRSSRTAPIHLHVARWA